MRIIEHPVLDFEARRSVRFTMDGVPFLGLEGEPIAAALLANGIRTFRHTHHDGEPRGVFCGIGQCCECMVVVDGKPNVRSCITPLKEGMCVCTQEGYAAIGNPLTDSETEQ